MGRKISASLVMLLCLIFVNLVWAQKDNPANDPEAAALLQKVSDKYKAYKNISGGFSLYIQRPKLKPEDDDRKYMDTIKGQVLLQSNQFKVVVPDQQVYCDGKNVWTYVPADKEVQLNNFEESDDMFSPSKIFTMYKEGYLYNIKEKKVVNGKHITVIEMAPPNKKLTWFKIDISIDDNALELVESKVYEKNGTRYTYKVTKQAYNVTTTDQTFKFDEKKYPGVKLVDLR